MSLDSDIKVLERVKLFEGFEPEHLRLLAFGAEARMVEEDEQLYVRGELADCGYVIVEGRMDLISGANDDVVKQYGPGSLLGELALITETQRPATAQAARQTQVLKLSRALFRRILVEYPHLAELLQERIGESVTEFVDRLDYVRTRLDRTDQQLAQKSAEPS